MFRDAGRFLYSEAEAEHRVVKSIIPGGEPQTMWRFPRSEMPAIVAVFQDRLAWVVPPPRFPPEAGDSTILYFAEAGGERVRVVQKIPGYLSWPAFSPDGRHLALTYSTEGMVDYDLAIIEIDPDGSVAGEPEIFDPVTKWWWGAQWAPDGRAIFVVGMAAQSLMDTDIWMVPLQPGAQAVAITQDDPNSVWGYALSPDGRHIAYASERILGSSIWRLEFGEGVLGGRR